MKINKIHRGISFIEAACMKSYIELNTQLRTEASNEFEKDFFKLMNNSVFGKTMENIRNHVDVRLRTSEKSAEKLVSKPNYERTTIFSEDLIAVHMKKQNLYSTSQFISECQSWIYQRLLCMVFIIITSRKSMDQKQSC